MPGTGCQVPSPSQAPDPADCRVAAQPEVSLTQIPLTHMARAPTSSHICSTESHVLTIFLQAMRLLWLLFRLGVHGRELVAEGLLHNSRWHHLLRKHFRTHHDLTSTTTPISMLQGGLWKNPVNFHSFSIHSFAKYLMCIYNEPSKLTTQWLNKHSFFLGEDDSH